ncbi:MAG TPA: FecR domain-containing protein [Polyangiaceae bacterium]
MVRRRRRFVTRVALGAACVGTLLFAAARFKHGEITPQSASLATPKPAASTVVGAVHYADGSVAELGPTGGVVHLDRQEAELVSSTVVSGRARFDVVSNHARTFEVHAGDVTVRVLGTAFVVERSGTGAHVSVERGRVRVSWPGGEAVLGVGETGEFPPVVAAAAFADASASPVSVESLPLAPHVWRDLAHHGRYVQAFAALRQTPNDVRDEPQDLLLAADVARLSSHPAQAVAPLRKVSQLYPKDPRAPVAAFTLGRVLLDDLGRASEAASAFALAESLWPSGPLAGDALAREVEALKRSGQMPQARAIAEKYVTRHPDGRHAAALRAMLITE